MMTRRVGIVLGVLLALCGGAPADVIDVTAGPGAIATGVSKAKEGDTVRLAAGEYTESVELPAGVTLEGAGADKTTVTGAGYAVINCTGPRVTVRGITIKPAEKTVRGVNTSAPVRVERCRFVGVKEGVALMGAPLSDVVACEFIDCGIGVRAIAEACPTVYGCWFKGGGMGVFGMNGMPYIRNNLFQDQGSGVRMVVGDEQAIIRNNLFLGCKDAGMELAAKDSIFPPSIRNNIFARCGSAISGDEAMFKATSHCLVHEVQAPAFRSEAGAELLALGQREVAEGDAGVAIGADGAITLAHPELVEGKGVRSSEEKEGAVGRIGPEIAWLKPGCSTTAELPPPRFGGALLIANAVAEEYQYLRALGLRPGGQSMGNENGRPVDRMSVGGGNGPTELKFDIGRFFGEMSIKP